MKVFFLFFVVAVVTSSLDDVTFEWEMFKVEYGKTYSSDKEHAKRFHIFRKNYHYIKQHNRLYKAGESSFALGINEFADMTNEEFAAQFNGFSAAEMVRDPANQYEVYNVENLPKAVDWRKKGYVTPVKNQGQCGSCWAFSAVGSTEGAHFKKTGKLVSLSEQNLVDCEKPDLGCNGGLMDHAFAYIIKNKGIDTETSYPYKAEDEKCEFKTADVGATISSYNDIEKGSEHALTSAIAKEGPVSVGIDASHPSFQLYKKGIYNEPECSSTQLDHGVLAVGYGSFNSTDYYIVKNSWGVSWGQQGYIWMSRNKKNQCGIASAASFPIASD